MRFKEKHSEVGSPWTVCKLFGGEWHHPQLSRTLQNHPLEIVGFDHILGSTTPGNCRVT